MTDEKSLLDLVENEVGTPVDLQTMQKGITKTIRKNSIDTLKESLAFHGVEVGSMMYISVLELASCTETSFAFSKKDISTIVGSISAMSKFNEATVIDIENILVVYIRDVLNYFLVHDSIYYDLPSCVELIQVLYKKLMGKNGTICTLSNEEAESILYRATWSTRLKSQSMIFAKDFTQLDVLVGNVQSHTLSDLYDGPTLLAAYIMRRILNKDVLFKPLDADQELSLMCNEYMDMFNSMLSVTIEDMDANPAIIIKPVEGNETMNIAVVESIAMVLSSIMDDLIKFAIDIRFKLNMVDTIIMMLHGIHSEVFSNSSGDDSNLLITEVVNAFELGELFDSFGENDLTVEDIMSAQADSTPEENRE